MSGQHHVGAVLQNPHFLLQGPRNALAVGCCDHGEHDLPRRVDLNPKRPEGANPSADPEVDWNRAGDKSGVGGPADHCPASSDARDDG